MNKEAAVQIIEKALGEGRKTLSEYEAKQILASYRIPVTREILVDCRSDVGKAAAEIGYPLVMKGCSSEIAHKTERDLIQMDIRSNEEALNAFDRIVVAMNGQGGSVLIQEMVQGRRELVMGLTRDDQFGPCVMFGLGGIFTEILKDIAFRRAPLTRRDALDLMAEIKSHKILESARGMEAADKDKLAQMLMQVGQIGIAINQIREIDLNPVIISRGNPIAVDALIVLK
jgi:acetyl-CoA synthetase (ADP-forming)